MGICKTVVINNGIKYGSSFFVVPGNEPEFLGMPVCEWLKKMRSR